MQTTFTPRVKCPSLLKLEQQLSTQNLKQIHAQLIINNLLQTPSLISKLIKQYCNGNYGYGYAESLLTHNPDLFLFNTLLRCTQPNHSLLVFANWVSKQTLLFDDRTYIHVLGACARSPNYSLSTLFFGRQLHVRIVKLGFLSNLSVATTLIHFYGSNKDIKSARQVFDEMPVKSSVTWNTMIAGYCSQREKGNDHCAFNGLLLFKDMLTCGTSVSDTTFVCVLSAVSRLGLIHTGACVHAYMQKTIDEPETDLFIGTALVHMYSKCACIDIASSIFTQMGVKNVLTWTAMATGLALHGRGKQALELLDKMVTTGRIKPNAVTFTSLFSACCHGGLVEEGLYLFHSMEKIFSVVPQIQHYSCVVDLLGKAGYLKEAYEIIERMPIEADAILWRSLLSACKVHGDVIMGEKVAKILLELKPCDQMIDESEDYVALSNIYASAERWREVEILRKEMKVKRIETNPGTSLV
ncbi:hypothetical protein ACFE04_024564 [Oxalis oulophora]